MTSRFVCCVALTVAAFVLPETTYASVDNALTDVLESCYASRGDADEFSNQLVIRDWTNLTGQIDSDDIDDFHDATLTNAMASPDYEGLLERLGIDINTGKHRLSPQEIKDKWADSTFPKFTTQKAPQTRAILALMREAPGKVHSVQCILHSKFPPSDEFQKRVQALSETPNQRETAIGRSSTTIIWHPAQISESTHLDRFKKALGLKSPMIVDDITMTAHLYYTDPSLFRERFKRDPRISFVAVITLRGQNLGASQNDRPVQ